MTTITVGNGDNVLDEGVLTGTELIVGNGSNQIILAPGSTNDTIVVGDGNNTINADGLSHSSITVGNGINTIIANGDADTINSGYGFNTIIANGNGDTITSFGPIENITATGSGDTITLGDGRDTITAGPSATVTAGNGNDTVAAGANSVIQLGIGNDTISAGTSDTITIDSGKDIIEYNGLTPAFTVPASLTVAEEHSTALPITLGPPALGHEVVSGFNPFIDVITLDTADFADFAAVKAHASQVGPDTVVTLDPGDTITLKNVALSSLSPKNFTFFNGTAVDQITITGVPSDATLSAGTKNPDGSWTLTVTQLTGLTLNADEPIGYPNPVNLGVTIINPAGRTASANQNVALTVNPLPPTIGVSVLAPHSGDPVTETRLSITATADDFPADGASDFINRIALSGLPAGVTLSTGNTITPGSQLGTFTTEVDVFAPADQSTNFNLGVTAFADEPNSPETSAATSQPINIHFSAQSQSLDFMTSDQSIWDTGAEFTKTFSTGFLGIDTSKSGSTKATVLGATVASAGGSIHFKAGFEAGLHITAGDISVDLPFDVGLDSTYNKTTDTLQIVPSEMQLGGGTFTEHGPGGSLSFGIDLGLNASGHATLAGIGPSFSTGTIGSFTKPVFQKTITSATKAVDIPIGPLTLTLAFPTVDVNGSNPAAGPISGKGTSQDAINLAVDLVALASLILTDGADDVTDFSVGPLSVDLLDILVGFGLNLVQSFDVSASGLTPTLTLGTKDDVIPFSLTNPTTITNVSGHGLNANGTVPFSVGVTPNGDVSLHNDTAIGANLTAELQALGLSIGPIGGFLFDTKGAIQLGTFPPLFNKSLPLLGFNSHTISATV
jgi:hypothetical protein